jgi:hypothetical protein
MEDDIIFKKKVVTAALIKNRMTQPIGPSSVE